MDANIEHWYNTIQRHGNRTNVQKVGQGNGMDTEKVTCIYILWLYIPLRIRIQVQMWYSHKGKRICC